ncbi:MAG: NlpC/P60 family protein [Campylobacterota bacterium]|nr:NlpC/P60 family protein [Campylobacterota bacterium]
MLKLFFTLIFIFSSALGSLFTITDKKGNLLHSKEMQPKNNASINQKDTEYSFQAIYNELHSVENLARRAAIAKERATRIAQAQKEAKKKGLTYQLTDSDRKKLLDYAKYFKGGKYVWGGTTPQGFDCSGYVQYLYKKHKINLPRTAWAQSRKGKNIEIHSLQKGDLLFFLTDKKRGIPVTHVGIYLGNGEFIHAASKKKGIIISPIYHGYYANKFVSAKRVISHI